MKPEKLINRAEESILPYTGKLIKYEILQQIPPIAVAELPETPFSVDDEFISSALEIDENIYINSRRFAFTQRLIRVYGPPRLIKETVLQIPIKDLTEEHATPSQILYLEDEPVLINGVESGSNFYQYEYRGGFFNPYRYIHQTIGFSYQPRYPNTQLNKLFLHRHLDNRGELIYAEMGINDPRSLNLEAEMTTLFLLPETVLTGDDFQNYLADIPVQQFNPGQHGIRYALRNDKNDFRISLGINSLTLRFILNKHLKADYQSFLVPNTDEIYKDGRATEALVELRDVYNLGRFIGPIAELN